MLCTPLTVLSKLLVREALTYTGKQKVLSTNNIDSKALVMMAVMLFLWFRGPDEGSRVTSRRCDTTSFNIIFIVSGISFHSFKPLSCQLKPHIT